MPGKQDQAERVFKALFEPDDKAPSLFYRAVIDGASHVKPEILKAIRSALKPLPLAPPCPTCIQHGPDLDNPIKHSREECPRRSALAHRPVSKRSKTRKGK